MKNENYGLVYTLSDGERGFCFINSDDEQPNQIDSYENVLATKKKLEELYSEVDYQIVRLTMEEVE